jgi:hypothetical protein
MGCSENSQLKTVLGDAGYVLEDVPHLTDYIPDLLVSLFLSLSDFYFVDLFRFNLVLRSDSRCLDQCRLIYQLNFY